MQLDYCFSLTTYFTCFRVKCPYCPVEQYPVDAKQIFFWKRSQQQCIHPDSWSWWLEIGSAIF